jgi:cell division protein FtsA
MGEIIVGLDIGTTKVVALVCNVEDGNIEIIGMGKAPSHGLEKGVVVDIGETTASIKRAIEEAENMADVRSSASTPASPANTSAASITPGRSPSRARTALLRLRTSSA